MSRAVRNAVATGLLVLGAAVPADGALATATDTTEAIRFRAEFGFDTSLQTLTQVAASADADVRYGVALTPNEAAEMDRRIDVESNLDDLDKYLDALPGFGGLYIDQAAGHVFVIEVLDPAEVRESELEAALPEGSGYEVRQVRHSEDDLRSLQDRIFADEEWLASLGVRAFEIVVDVRDNVVEVGISRLDAAVARAIVDRYGQGWIELYEAKPGQLSVCSSRNSCNGPLRGGVQLYDAGCSTAFIMSKSASYYFLTAGHCYISGHTYQHPNDTNLGQMTSEVYYDNTSADAGLVPIPYSQRSRRVYVTAGSWYSMFDVQSRTTADGDVPGATVCLSGRQRGEGISCGTIYAVDFPFEACNGTYPNCTGYTTLLHQRSGTYSLAVGDSGGAIVSGNTAVGVQSSINTAGRGIYSHITYAQSMLGAYVCQSACP